MNARLRALITSRAPAATLLIRIMVGAVFVSEGIQKFLYPAAVGAGRFAKIGIPSPDLMGPLVGVIEIACGALVLLGLLTRLAAMPLIGVMVVAIVSTKIPILLGEELWGFALRKLPEYGFWSMAHEARTDFAMLLGSTFLALVGAGPRSIDHRIATRTVA